MSGKRYWVSIPTAGTLTVIVDREPESCEDAFQLAMQAMDGGDEGEHEWTTFESLVKGNVLYVPQNEADWGEE